MTEVKLTPRLAIIAGLVPEGAALADVGTDHAHIPIALLQKGKIARAIASDIHQGPLDRAAENLKQAGFAGRVSLRLGAGLAPIGPEECDTIVIAGMGGETIAEILREAPWTAAGAHTLLLQPMTMAPRLRQFLWEGGYQITEERVCREGNRFYVILRATGGEGREKTVPLAQCYLSEPLLTAPGAADYLRWLLGKEEAALAGMERAAAPGPDEMKHLRCVLDTLTHALEGLT